MRLACASPRSDPAACRRWNSRDNGPRTGGCWRSHVVQVLVGLVKIDSPVLKDLRRRLWAIVPAVPGIGRGLQGLSIRLLVSGAEWGLVFTLCWRRRRVVPIHGQPVLGDCRTGERSGSRASCGEDSVDCWSPTRRRLTAQGAWSAAGIGGRFSDSGSCCVADSGVADSGTSGITALSCLSSSIMRLHQGSFVPKGLANRRFWCIRMLAGYFLPLLRRGHFVSCGTGGYFNETEAWTSGTLPWRRYRRFVPDVRICRYWHHETSISTF